MSWYLKQQLNLDILMRFKTSKLTVCFLNWFATKKASLQMRKVGWQLRENFASAGKKAFRLFFLYLVRRPE